MATSDVALLLRMEHQNFSKLLDILSQHLDGLDQDQTPDYALIEAILAYFRGYADECHHPKEDLVYRKLETRRRPDSEGLGDLVHDHADLAALTQRAAERVQSAREAGKPLNAPLESDLRAFVESYRRHIALEEKYFLTAAEQALSEDDWGEIEFDLFDRKDPLFDAGVEQRFLDLRKQIEQMERRA